MKSYRKSPWRSPKVVSDAISDIIKDKVVCELGCAEGDNMVFMSRYAKEVIGFEFDPDRGRYSEERGLKIIYGDYHIDELPKADVYYFWPDISEKDSEFLVDKIYSNEDFKEGVIIVGGDAGYANDISAVNRCINRWNGELIEVPFNEGRGWRQSGIFLLGVIKKKLLSLDSRRVIFSNMNNRNFNFTSTIDIDVNIKVYSEKLKKTFYTTNMKLNSGHDYFVSHPCFINLKEVNIEFSFNDEIENIVLKDELKSQPEHILNYYTEEEYDEIEPYINWSYTEIMVDDNYGISNLNEDFFESIKTVVDLGANIGTFGKFISKKSDIDKYICVEPFDKLKPVIEIHNKNLDVKVYTNAYDIVKRIIPFYFYKDIFENALNFTMSDETYKPIEEMEKVDVQTITLSDIFEDNNLDIIDILKVDIEGSEVHLVNEKDNLLNKIKYIVIEAHSDFLKQEIINELSNFEVISINESPGVPHIFLQNKLLIKKETLVNKSKVLIKVSSPAMGDILCSTPTIRKASNSYGFKVDVMTNRPDIFKNNLYVNNILEFTGDDVEGYDEVFETFNPLIKVNKNLNDLEFYDKPISIKIMNFEARQFHALGLGITLYPEEMHYDYLPDDQTEDSKKITKDFLVFHITESWPSRTWDREKWQRLVDLVKQNTDFKIVIVGKSHLEPTYYGDMKKGIIDLDNIDYNYCDGTDVDSSQGKMSESRPLSELWHIINNSFALISFDSGPIHLAGTTDTDIIEIGSNIRPERSAPYRKGTQDYKFHFVGGECKIFCASDPKYSVKEWGSINSMAYVPECQEEYDDFYCQPTPEQVFFKIVNGVKGDINDNISVFKSKKKIIYVSPHCSTGGSPEVLRKWVEMMKDEYEVHVVEFTQYFLGFNVQRKRIIEMLGEDNFHTLGGLEYKHGNQTYDEYVEKRMGLWELIKKIKPDVVHFNEVPELFLDLVNPHRGLPEELGKKIYSEDRDYLIFETTHDSMWDAKNNKVWLPDKFIFISKWHLDVYKHFDVPMEVIEYPVEIKERPDRATTLEELGLDPEYKHVLNVGLWSSRKNQGEIVDIAKLMVNDKVMFHFIGNLSADFIDYWEKCMVDLPDSCVVHDERDDVDKFCSCMDLFLFTSRGDDSDKETNPIVLKEALSWQMPIMLYNLDVYLGMYDDEESMTFLTGDKYKDIENIKKIII